MPEGHTTATLKQIIEAWGGGREATWFLITTYILYITFETCILTQTDKHRCILILNYINLFLLLMCRIVQSYMLSFFRIISHLRKECSREQEFRGAIKQRSLPLQSYFSSSFSYFFPLPFFSFITFSLHAFFLPFLNLHSYLFLHCPPYCLDSGLTIPNLSFWFIIFTLFLPSSLSFFSHSEFINVQFRCGFWS